MLPCRPRRTPTVSISWRMALGDGAAGARRLDDLVDDADLHGLVDAAGDALVLGRQLGLDLRTDLGGDLRQLASVEDHGWPPRRP